MDASKRTAGDELKAIARRVMRERGLQPDYSRAVWDETRAITGPATASGTEFRDLRDLLWASIDNDDSRDLDQLSVAQPLPDGSAKMLRRHRRCRRPRQGWHRRSTGTRATTRRPSTRQPRSSRCCRRSCRPTSRRSAEGEERLAVVVEMTIAADGAVVDSDHLPRGGAQSREARLRRRSRLARRHRGARPPGFERCPASTSSSVIQDRVAQTLKRVRHQRGALRLETLEARAVFEDGVLADLRPETKNRARELIEDFMIAANGVTAKYPGARGLRVAAARPPLARALGSDRRAGDRARRAPAAGAERCSARRFPGQARARPIRCAFPTSRSPSSS